VRGTTFLAAVRLAAVVRGARHSNESEWQFDDELPYGFEEMRRVVDIATAAHSTPVEQARACIALTALLDEFTHELPDSVEQPPSSSLRRAASTERLREGVEGIAGSQFGRRHGILQAGSSTRGLQGIKKLSC